MNKLEEKIEDVITTYSINSGVVEKLKEITEQECIGFAEWKDEASTKIIIRHLILTNKPHSNSDLFQLYLKSKENE